MDKKSIMKRIDALEAALPGNKDLSLVIIKPCSPAQYDESGKPFVVSEQWFKRGVRNRYGIMGVTYETKYLTNCEDYKRPKGLKGPMIILVRGVKDSVCGTERD